MWANTQRKGWQFSFVWCMNCNWIRGDTHLTSTLRKGSGGGEKMGNAKMRCYPTLQYLFLLKRIRFAPWPDIMLSQTWIYYIDSGVGQRSHPLMIPLHCLWAKSNNRTCGQFEGDVTWFCFCFDFVRCTCCSIVC